jgi:hypothetical protein
MNSENEHDKLIERLQLAEQLVERAQLHDALRPAAFAEVLQALNGQQADGEGHDVDVAGRDRRRTGQSHSKPNVSGLSERLAAVAEALRVDASVVNQVFADDGGELLFVLPSRRLANTTFGAMRQIVILTACARQAGGWDDAWTTAATLRAACESAGVYSGKHFTTVVGRLDIFAVRGTGGSREVRAHPASYEAARAVLGELVLLPEVSV